MEFEQRYDECDVIAFLLTLVEGHWGLVRVPGVWRPVPKSSGFRQFVGMAWEMLRMRLRKWGHLWLRPRPAPFFLGSDGILKPLRKCLKTAK